MINRKLTKKKTFLQPISIGLLINGDRGLHVFNQIMCRNEVTIKWIIHPVYSTIADKLDTTKKYQKVTVRNALELNGINSELEHVDILLCAGFPFKISEQILSKASITSVNLHGGPLPAYRGGSPLMWQIINGEKRIGISIHELEEDFDTGDVILESNFLLDDKWSISDVLSKVNIEFTILLNNFLNNYQTLLSNKHSQSNGKARYWHQRNPQDGSVDWTNNDSLQVYNFVRAISNPYPGAFGTLLSGNSVRIWEVKIDEVPVCGSTGRIVVLSDGPHVVCGQEGSVLLTRFESKGVLVNGDRFITWS